MWLMAFAGLLLCRCLAATIGAPAPVHKIDGTMIREWLVLGPFPTQQLETDFLAEAGGEADAKPKEGDMVMSKDGRRLAWTRLNAPNDLVDLERIFGLEHPNAVAYAFCDLESDQTGESTLRGVSNIGSPVWIEGRRVGTIGTERGTVIDARTVVPVQLKAGKNRCLIKLLSTHLYGFELMVQPLPFERAVADLEVVDSGRRPVSGASIQFYDQGKLVARVRTDRSRPGPGRFPSRGGVVRPASRRRRPGSLVVRCLDPAGRTAEGGDVVDGCRVDHRRGPSFGRVRSRCHRRPSLADGGSGGRAGDGCGPGTSSRARAS